MIIGPRYKKARYLGVPVFRKTQTPKFAMRAQRKAKTSGRRGAKSEYGRQMLEKQRARFSYGIGGKQFTNYVKKALQAKGDNAKNLMKFLESRVDNVLVRAGFAPTRMAARQMVSHGHILINGKKTTIPSHSIKVGDVLTIRPGSANKVIFSTLAEEFKTFKWPNWLTVDQDKKIITVVTEPTVDMTELLFDVGQVLEFYTR